MPELKRELVNSLSVALRMTEAYENLTDEVVKLASGRIVENIKGLPNDLRSRVLEEFEGANDPATLVKRLDGVCGAIAQELEAPHIRLQRWANNGKLMSRNDFMSVGVSVLVVLTLVGAVLAGLAVRSDWQNYEKNNASINQIS